MRYSRPASQEGWLFMNMREYIYIYLKSSHRRPIALDSLEYIYSDWNNIRKRHAAAAAALLAMGAMPYK